MWLKMLCSKVLVTLGDQNEAVIVTFQEEECVGLATCSSYNSTNSSLVAVDYLLHFLPFTIFVCTKSADLAYTWSCCILYNWHLHSRMHHSTSSEYVQHCYASLAC